MFVNIFPKTLSGLMRQTYPRHRFQPAMRPLITAGDYLAGTSPLAVERQILSRDELATATAFASSKRQNEWLTARICAKMAAIQYLHGFADEKQSLNPREMLIASNHNGRPYLAGRLSASLRTTDLSLSHGAGFGLALIADSRCGIDIQEPRASLFKVREKFCTSEEEDLLRQHMGDLPEIQHLTLLWTAKEAAKKALSYERMPGFLELILNETEAHAAGWTIRFLVSSRHFRGYPAAITVAAELYEGYGIALCLTGTRLDA